MHTLPNPRWESFALTLAAGCSPEESYRDAGFSDKNAKARAQALRDHPDIKARVAHLRTCLPRILTLQQRFAPSFLVMPQSREEMVAWLWQVMSGSRRIPPMQLRAATLFVRLNGWHLTKPTPPGEGKPVEFLNDQERHALALFSSINAETDAQLQPPDEADSRNLYSALADAALKHPPSLIATYAPNYLTPEPAAETVPAPAAPTTPQPPAPSPKPAAVSPRTTEARKTPTPVCTPLPQSTPPPAAATTVTAKNPAAAPAPNGEPKSPFNPLGAQQVAPILSPNGDQKAIRQSVLAAISAISAPLPTLPIGHL